MEFLLMDWLGTPVWFWLSFIGIVATSPPLTLVSCIRKTRKWVSANR
jgi:hypothetical protein